MTRTTTIPNGNPGGNKTNGASLGAAAIGSSSSARKQPLQHIDDVTSVNIDFNRFTQIDKLLAKAEDLLREAETFRNFGGRIDMAMKSYIKANILLLDVIKKNKGWVSLAAGDNKAQKKRYDELLRQIKSTQGVFEQIKLEIKDDNQSSGVQPTYHGTTKAEGVRLGVPQENRHSLDDGGSSDGILTPASSPRAQPGPLGVLDQAKPKPSVRPKPEALHGKAIQPDAAKRAADDLSKRFANLRPPTSAPQQLIQDPRIRTQPIIVPQASQRHDAGTSTARSSLSLDSDIYELPKMPGAIYKPARGTVSTEAAELPSSSSRRFSLARSLTSGSLNSPSVKSPVSGPGEEANEWARRNKLGLPEGETLSVTELLRLMKEGAKSVSLLLIDIRSREAFDEGHIMSQATICIEPEVLMRKNISASEIAESMVLAPSAEQINFERRHRFDLVVFYDQNSTHIGTKQSNPGGAAVQGLYNALTYFDFVGENSRKPPKLLEGGLDAWTGVMGSSSLATTETSTPRPVGSSSTKTRQNIYAPRRRQSHVPRPIQDADEARRWEQSTNDPELFRPLNQDDFLRRYPSVSVMKESMVSPPSIGTAHGNHSMAPPNYIDSEPRRPAPTVAKTSFSGFSGKDEHDKDTKLVTRSQGDKSGAKRRVGLRNPGNLCYANSSLQALFGTPGFATDLATGAWAGDYMVPMKSDEKIPNPQLLAKMLSQLFGWMDKALIHPMEARTLMVSTYA
jgi:ubiquitin carboxyl-terminal hydrolase 8